MSGSCSCDLDKDESCVWCLPERRRANPRHPEVKVPGVDDEMPALAAPGRPYALTNPAPFDESHRAPRVLSKDTKSLLKAISTPAVEQTEVANVPYVDSHVRTIRGDEYDAYMEFCAAARELRAQGESLRKAQERYKAALEIHSELACKVDA